MINVNEFRVGNEVIASTGVAKVDESNVYEWIDFEPIEVTHELLVEKGFSKTKKNHTKRVGNFDVAVPFNNKFIHIGHVGSCQVISIELKSFHHLQNVVFALIGEEL